MLRKDFSFSVSSNKGRLDVALDTLSVKEARLSFPRILHIGKQRDIFFRADTHARVMSEDPAHGYY